MATIIREISMELKHRIICAFYTELNRNRDRGYTFIGISKTTVLQSSYSSM